MTAAVFDFETKSSYSIRVSTTDATGQPFEDQLTVTVTDVAEDTPAGGGCAPGRGSPAAFAIFGLLAAFARLLWRAAARPRTSR